MKEERKGTIKKRKRIKEEGKGVRKKGKGKVWKRERKLIVSCDVTQEIEIT